MDLSRFDGIQVLDVDGRETALTSLLAGQPTVLVFVRHFG